MRFDPAERQTSLDANMAFEKALRDGRLSHDTSAPNWVGHYMYMGFNADIGRDCFKHREARRYLP